MLRGTVPSSLVPGHLMDFKLIQYFMVSPKTTGVYHCVGRAKISRVKLTLLFIHVVNVAENCFYKKICQITDNLEDIDTNDFLINPHWTIANSSATKNVKYYPCCQEPYPDLTYDLLISEKES